MKIDLGASSCNLLLLVHLTDGVTLPKQDLYAPLRTAQTENSKLISDGRSPQVWAASAPLKPHDRFLMYALWQYHVFDTIE